MTGVRDAWDALLRELRTDIEQHANDDLGIPDYLKREAAL
jgi:hypothetical protein